MSIMYGDDFDTWSVNKAFTREYFPHNVTCNFCSIPKSDAHMCVFNSGEIVKMQPCPEDARSSDLLFAIKYKNYVCKSCFIKCKPSRSFVKGVKESIQALNAKLSSFLDQDFVQLFCLNVYDFLIKDTTLTCVPCSLTMQDYKWTTYRKFTSSNRKRRLESTIII